jgi:hypothetical protein
MNRKASIVKRDNTRIEGVAGTKGNTICTYISIFKRNNLSVIVSGDYWITFDIWIIEVYCVACRYGRRAIDRGRGVMNYSACRTPNRIQIYSVSLGRFKGNSITRLIGWIACDGTICISTEEGIA